MKNIKNAIQKAHNAVVSFLKGFAFFGKLSLIMKLIMVFLIETLPISIVCDLIFQDAKTAVSVMLIFFISCWGQFSVHPDEHGSHYKWLSRVFLNSEN